eukprot:s4916_g1.t1
MADGLPSQTLQLSVLMLLGSMLLGLLTVGYAKGFKFCWQSPEEAVFYFVGGLFAGFVLLEIFAALMMSLDLVPDLGPPEIYELALGLAVLAGLGYAKSPVAMVRAELPTLLLFLPAAWGHSYLALPASRNLLANLAGREDCPHCLQSGGPDNVKERGSSTWPSRLAPTSHGLCGDPVQGKSNPTSWKDETHLKSGPITATYRAGEIVEFQVAVSTHHLGHYEFRICDRVLNTSTVSSPAEGQQCLDQWLLQRAPPLADCQVNDARGDCQPLDPKHPERWYLPPAGSQTPVAGPNFDDSMAPSYPSSAEVHVMRYKLPEALSCSACTLQWYWSSGNSCVYDGDYFDYYRGIAQQGWDASAWQPQILASWATCDAW